MARRARASEAEQSLTATDLAEIDDLCEAWRVVLRRRDAYTREVVEHGDFATWDEPKLDALNRALKRQTKHVPRDVCRHIWPSSDLPTEPGKLAARLREYDAGDDVHVMSRRLPSIADLVEPAVEAYAKWSAALKPPSLDEERWREVLVRCARLAESGYCSAELTHLPPSITKLYDYPRADGFAAAHAWLAPIANRIGQKNPRESAAKFVGKLLGKKYRYVQGLLAEAKLRRKRA